MWPKETVWTMQGGDDAFIHMPHRHGELDRLALASPLLTATGWIDGLARLVALDARNGDGIRPELADALHDMFAPLGFGLQRLAVPSARTPDQPMAMVAARRAGRRACTLYFNVDTLSAGEGWTRAPFTLTRDGSRLYGRGTTDTKGAIAAVWAALRAADAVGLGLGFDPVLLFCAETPIGEHAGLRHLVTEGLVEGHVVYLNGTTAPRVWTASPGTIHVCIALQARDSAVPPSIPPVEACAPVMMRLTALRAAMATRGQGMTLGEPCTEEAGYDDSAIASIQGSVVGGLMPDACRISLGHTYLSPVEIPGIVAEVERAVRDGLLGIDGLVAEIRVVSHTPPVAGADQGPNGDRWRQALSWGFGFSADAFRPWSGTLASPVGFVQQAGIQEILLGGLRRPDSRIGAADEFTTVEDIEALARSLLAYLSDVGELPTY